ncbi:MAG: trehalose-phosphatase [Ferrimicrobium sp.]
MITESRWDRTRRFVIENPRQSGLAVDFDGTIAPMVPTPDMAQVDPTIKMTLTTLAARLGLVGVISGRPPDFLRSQLPDHNVMCIGNYGRPSAPDPEVLAEIAHRVAKLLPTGVTVELKPNSIVLHYRADPDKRSWATQFASSLAKTEGLFIEEAKYAFELSRSNNENKGTALARVTHSLDAVVYIGDDLGDLAAFDYLHERARHGCVVCTIAVDSSELPDALRTRADLLVSGVAGVTKILLDLASTN